jgi:DNA-binding LacI/PurR family transcriptional regulator
MTNPKVRSAPDTVKRAVTSIEVAARAGVSQSAVSRTFSVGTSVSEETRKKVMRAARELSYRPNAIARTLSTRQSNIIGIVLSTFENQLYPVVVEQLSRALQLQGKHTMLFLADKQDSDSAFNEILSYQLDGVVIASATLASKLAKQCAEMGIPVVMFNRATDGTSTDSVTSDNRRAGQLVAEALIASGHERIAYISGREDSSTNRDREHGLREALRSGGMALFAQANGNYEQAQASAAAVTLMSARNKPDAIVVASDHMAFSVIDTLRYTLHLQVPNDVSVVGFDDVPQSAWLAYQLTTVAQSVEKMVRATVELLMSPATIGQGVSRNVVVACELIHRTSIAQRKRA